MDSSQVPLAINYDSIDPQDMKPKQYKAVNEKDYDTGVNEQEHAGFDSTPKPPRQEKKDKVQVKINGKLQMQHQKDEDQRKRDSERD